MKKRIMKKRVMSLLLAAGMLVSAPITAYAATGDAKMSNQAETEKQEQIERLLDALNRFNVEEAYDRCTINNALRAGNSAYAKKLTAEAEIQKDNHEAIRQEYEAELEKLGVHKIDPSNPEDMEILETMQKEMVPSSINGDVYDTAPDFSMIANLYTLRILDGVTTYNNVNYNYRYIIVTDDKGHDGLYYYQDNSLAANVSSSVMSSVLNYNFGYILSSLLGVLPYGTVLNWTLGNIFSALSGVNASTVTSGREDFYGVRHNAVTEMVYYFFYNNGWRHIGTSGSAEVIREDYFCGNVNGRPVNETPKTTFTIKSNHKIWKDYVDDYASAMSAGRPDYCNISNLGKLTIKGYNNKTYYYAPPFAEMPDDLL